jgi:hypothetical protein
MNLCLCIYLCLCLSVLPFHFVCPCFHLSVSVFYLCLCLCQCPACDRVCVCFNICLCVCVWVIVCVYACACVYDGVSLYICVYGFPVSVSVSILLSVYVSRPCEHDVGQRVQVDMLLRWGRHGHRGAGSGEGRQHLLYDQDERVGMGRVPLLQNETGSGAQFRMTDSAGINSRQQKMAFDSEHQTSDIRQKTTDDIRQRPGRTRRSACPGPWPPAVSRRSQRWRSAGVHAWCSPMPGERRDEPPVVDGSSSSALQCDESVCIDHWSATPSKLRGSRRGFFFSTCFYCF